ncbi:MAG: hypothetical protein C4519_14950 [Desulfobacteraceae bacterium]|nr:MAG: hypothetical protein C4519_14950 [Desulfobacteraceae bacterium]
MASHGVPDGSGLEFFNQFKAMMRSPAPQSGTYPALRNSHFGSAVDHLPKSWESGAQGALFRRF